MHVYAVVCARRTTTVFVGDDMDLLVLLCYHADLLGCDIFFEPETKRNAKPGQIRRLWNIKKVKQQLGPELCMKIFYFFVPCLAVIPLHASMALEEQLY